MVTFRVAEELLATDDVKDMDAACKRHGRHLGGKGTPTALRSHVGGTGGRGDVRLYTTDRRKVQACHEGVPRSASRAYSWVQPYARKTVPDVYKRLVSEIADGTIGARHRWFAPALSAQSFVRHVEAAHTLSSATITVRSNGDGGAPV